MGVTLHFISNFMVRGGAEAMLARYVLHAPAGSRRIVSLVGATDQPFEAGGSETVNVTALGAGSLPRLLRSIWTLRRIIRTEKPSALVCWMYHAHIIGTLAAILAGFKGPVIWNIRHGLDDIPGLSRTVRMSLWIGRLLRFRADCAVSNSGRTIAQHVAYGYVRGGTVIPNGMHLPPPPLPRTRPPRRIGIAGRLHPDKDHANFFAAAARVAHERQDVRFVAAGRWLETSNPEALNMIDRAGLAQDRIELLGDLANLDDFYRSIDLLVLSSRTEGFPNVLMEAMSFGVPCVTTDVGDAGEIVGETGLIVPPRDEAALAGAILAFLDMPPEEIGRRSAAARRRIEERYAIDRVAERYDAVIASCADRRSGPAT